MAFEYIALNIKQEPAVEFEDTHLHHNIDYESADRDDKEDDATLPENRHYHSKDAQLVIKSEPEPSASLRTASDAPSSSHSNEHQLGFDQDGSSEIKCKFHSDVGHNSNKSDCKPFDDSHHQLFSSFSEATSNDTCSKRNRSTVKHQEHRKKRNPTRPEGKFECIYCSRVHNSIDTLRSHMNSQLPGNTICVECNRQFPSRFCFIYHLDTVHLAASPMACLVQECNNLVFYSWKSWDQHRRQAHAVYECMRCGETLDNRNALKHHYLKHLVCNCCQLEFRTKAAKRRHHQLMKSNGDQRRDSGFTEQLKKIELRHKPVVIGKDVRKRSVTPPPCDLCDCQFKTHWSLTSHIRRYHSPSLPFQCSGCSYRFQTAELLEGHLRRRKYHKKQRKKASGLDGEVS